MKTHVTQAVKASLENRHVVINLDRAKIELVDAEKELNWLRSAAGSSQKEYEQNQKKIAELKMELERERWRCPHFSFFPLFFAQLQIGP